MDWKETINLQLRRNDYFRALDAYWRKPAVTRLFSRKPVDPGPGGVKIARALNGAFKWKDGDDEHYAYISFMSGTDGLPIANLTIYQNGCFHVSRILFTANGGEKELGCGYPYSECGFTGFAYVKETAITKTAMNRFKAVKEQISNHLFHEYQKRLANG